MERAESIGLSAHAIDLVQLGNLEKRFYAHKGHLSPDELEELKAIRNSIESRGIKVRSFLRYNIEEDSN